MIASPRLQDLDSLHHVRLRFATCRLVYGRFSSRKLVVTYWAFHFSYLVIFSNTIRYSLFLMPVHLFFLLFCETLDLHRCPEFQAFRPCNNKLRSCHQLIQSQMIPTWNHGTTGTVTE